MCRWLGRLLKRIGDSNSDAVLQRRAACQCLHELELNHPGLLARKIGHIAELCSAEKTHAVDTYMLLLSSALRNAVVLVSDSPPETAHHPSLWRVLHVRRFAASSGCAAGPQADALPRCVSLSPCACNSSRRTSAQAH